MTTLLTLPRPLQQKEVQKNFQILNSRVTALTGAFDTLSEVFVEEFDLLRVEANDYIS